MYAEGEGDYFIFTKENNTSTGLKLVETPYSQKLDKEVKIYLTKLGSTPAFLGSHTLHLFNSKTYAIK
jgi:hypothetical protein